MFSPLARALNFTATNSSADIATALTVEYDSRDLHDLHDLEASDHLPPPLVSCAFCRLRYLPTPCEHPRPTHRASDMQHGAARCHLDFQWILPM